VDKLVADLLEIERTALESMKDIEGEKAAHTLHTQEEISRRILEVKRHADKELQAQKQKAEAETQAQLDDIERQSQEKSTELKNLFEANTDIWRKQWVAHILQT